MPRESRERWAAVGPGLIALVCGLLTPSTSPAQSAGRPAPKAIPTRNQSFRIPFDIPPQDQGRIREVRLYFSVDSGQNWEAAGRVDPSRGSFAFRAPRDAEYWFAVQTVDTQGREFPPADAPFRGPNMRVIVDTTPPLIRLSPIGTGRRGSRAGVRWEIRDEYLDPSSLTIQYRQEGAVDWRTVTIANKSLIGEQEWEAGTAAPLLVQAWVDDQAGNRTLSELRLEEGIAAAPGPSVADLGNFEPPPPIAPIRTSSLPNPRREFAEPDGFTNYGPSSSAVADFYSAGSAATGTPAAIPYDLPTTDPEGVRSLLVGNPAFALQYEVEDAGPGGPALVELWVTRDGGQTWSRQPEDADHVSPYPVNLEGEGTYGLWLVVQSASGLGDRPPRPGDRPQLWVEVDTQAPVVRMNTPQIGVGPRLGQVRITWYASDSRLAPKPVLLSYRADDVNDRQWHPIAPRMDNTGEYIWTVPPDVPGRFHLRIDVIDHVGNQASDETTPNGPILVDRSRPRGRILGLDQGAQAGHERKTR